VWHAHGIDMPLEKLSKGARENNYPAYKSNLQIIAGRNANGPLALGNKHTTKA